jgi:chaperonin GroEL
LSVQYQKVKSVAKQMLTRGPELQKLILKTMKTCSDLVGSTLGPGGMSVVIERQEPGLPPVVTKDGVTVFRALGFENSTAQVLMEAARDASIRTAADAGDGTTTSAILAESLVRRTQEFCLKYPEISPQLVVRQLQSLFDDVIEPDIKKLARPADLSSEDGRKLLHGVARISANGDSKLADAVMNCFDVTGDDGNVTIIDSSGPSEYLVERIDGYPVPIGYEDCCGPFFPEFINDVGSQQCVLEKPLFLLYHGSISDYNQIWSILQLVAAEASDNRCSPNIVIAATGFSETVLANMAASFKMPNGVRPFPLRTPLTAIKSGQHDFLLDLAALTGTKVYNPLTDGLASVQRLEDFGTGPTSFEASRFRSTVIGYRDEILVLERVDEINKQLSGADLSEYDRTMLRERLAKLTSGIAKLIVRGSSNGEVKEKRDRAEDAVCAVRGALKYGVLPGGGHVLTYLAHDMLYETGDLRAKVAQEIMRPALLEPVQRLFTNAGYHPENVVPLMNRIESREDVFDIMEQKWVPVWDSVYDSVPAVREAIRNSISIAGLLGTCGGTVVFGRDADLERSEASQTADWLRNSTINEANERG